MDEVLGSRIREDVAVPPDRLDEMLVALRRIARAERVPLHTFAHLGEGSLHPNYVVDPASPRAERVRAALYRAALDLGGTISGEHGIGRLKRGYLAREVGPVAVRLLRSVRAACDPDGILNPGTLYPPPGDD
ncbi:FAD linked oxidase domain protein [mine drainage metagenome]|uniref:FAD linked oxidase domain protein n=2 Tax=mine drainage metagenome TaxID=410659 RepID=T0Z7S4_9ZZZZ